jgi:hypothetical protein
MWGGVLHRIGYLSFSPATLSYLMNTVPEVLAEESGSDFAAIILHRPRTRPRIILMHEIAVHYLSAHL